MPVFIVGFARSGTTLCQRLVAEQLGVPTLPETHFFERLDNYHPGERLMGAEGAAALLDELAELLPLEPSHFNDLLQGQQVNIRELFLRIVAEQLGSRALASSGRWIEKTPLHALYAGRIAKLFPKAMFICMVRNPAMAFASRRELNEPGKGWGEPWRPIEALCDEWAGLMRSIHGFAAQAPGKVLFVRLEDLSAKPQRELTRIARFLALEPDDGVGDVEEDTLMQPFETWKADALKPADRSISERAGRSQLDAYDQWRVQTLLAAELKTYKYLDRSVAAPAMDDLHRKLMNSIDWLRASLSAAMAALLEVEQLRISLPGAAGRVDAVRGVSFTMQPGATRGLIGESGCGKSLTALALIGLLPPGARASGSVRLAGQPLIELDDPAWCALRGRRVAMIFQEPMTALNPLHPIGRQIAEGLRLHQRLPANAAKAEALRLLDRVRLPDAARRLGAYPHQLSGGQRQRVMIAMALANRPALLIADEPTTALDVTLQREVLSLIAELVAEDGMGLLLISHDLGVMAHSVQQLMVMYAGNLVEQGPTTTLLRRPAHPYTRGLLAARPRLGLARGTRLPTIPGRVPALGELPAGCAFADRCDRVVADCRAAPPPALAMMGPDPRSDIGPAHSVHCLRPVE